MNKYRKEYCNENGMKTFNNYNVNDYTEFLEEKLGAINFTGSSLELLCECGSDDIYTEPIMHHCQDCGKSFK